ncbi:hypothetical protein WDV91_18495 [Curtobacterium flaccumfaciens pv. flaccumfaciens]
MRRARPRRHRPPPAATTAATTKCTSTAYKASGYTWPSTVKWYYNQTDQKSTYAKDALRKGGERLERHDLGV